MIVATVCGYMNIHKIKSKMDISNQQLTCRVKSCPFCLHCDNNLNSTIASQNHNVDSDSGLQSI